jgi:transcription factor C subunit 6
MRCEMVLCIDSGPPLELKWCPLPSHDSVRFPTILLLLQFIKA